MSEVNKQQQTAVASQDTQQQSQPQAQMSQPVNGQTIQVQITHETSEQIQGAQVASSQTTLNPTSTMVMAAPQQTLITQQPIQTLQNPPAIAPMPSQGNSATITTMSTGPPQIADWSGGRLQVIQQPIQNPTFNIQPVYNAQGQLIVPGNIAVHPGDINQSIQVITAGKSFQTNQMQQMLTGPAKPLVQNQTTSFPSFSTIPTSGNSQTLLISQLGLLGQTNILPQTSGKSQNVQKFTCNTQQQRTVTQPAAQTMQFAPWQATFGATGLPQGLTWAPGTIQSSALLTQGSQIFIRSPQPEQTAGMFIHNAQTSTIAQHNQITNHQLNRPNQAIEMGGNIQGKHPIPKTFSAILPNPLGPHPIRPASSVSTQTGAAHHSVHVRTRVRTKNVCRMSSLAAHQKIDGGHHSRSHHHHRIANTPGPSQENRLIKPRSSLNQVVSQQPQQLPQPLPQVQQIQTVLQEPVDTKGQVSNGLQNGGDRTSIPAVSVGTGQTQIGGTTIVQNIPGDTAMIIDPAVPGVSGLQIAQDIAGPSNINIKPGISVAKDGNNSENGVSENTSGSEESTLANILSSDKKNDTDDHDGNSSLLVKPQVLTHVIDGFVIQESSEPFPVNQGVVDQLLLKMPGEEDSESGEPAPKRPLVEEEHDNDTNENTNTNTNTNDTDAESDESRIDPSKWTVADVCEFIRTLPGCAEYVDDFAMQDIDGEALMLLKADHLMSAMSMKLGPAVKIIAKIDTIRVNPEGNPREES